MASADYSHLRVLIVDDFPSFRSALVKNMHALGFREIKAVASGSEAVGLCRRNHYDLILSDYNLGSGKNGQQFLEEIRVLNLMRPADIFILISADTSREVVMASYDCEPNDYLTKPITGKTLEQRIRRLMAKREVLVPAYQAIEEGNVQYAISLLERKSQESSRYVTDAQKLLGELYLKEQRYDQAENLYKKILSTRELNWALVGLANIEILRGNVCDAVCSLEDIVTEHPAYLKAYDSLSNACEALDDSDKLQEVLQRAATISPMSIGRQKSLADVALANGDMELAMKAYKKTIKYGAHSHYDSADNHLNLARAITKIYDDDVDKAQEFSLDAVKLLSHIDDKYEIDENQKIQVKLLNSQINALHGNKRASNELLQEAQDLMMENNIRDIDTEIESVNALIAANKMHEAKRVIEEMLAYYMDDQLALEKIDSLLEEPISEKGKKLIGKINKKGIDLYKAKDFSQSIHYFSQAQKKFPRYIGIKLNLVQAIIGDIKANGCHAENEEQCEKIFKVVERYIEPMTDKYNRYRQLKGMYQQVLHQARMQEKHKANEKKQQDDDVDELSMPLQHAGNHSDQRNMQERI